MQISYIFRMLSLGIAVLVNGSSHAEAGFFRLNDARIPQLIREQSQAILRLVTLSERPTQIILQSQYTKILARAKSNTPKEFLNHLVIIRVRECQSKQLKTCPIYFDATSTAFIAGEKNELWTVNHSWQTHFQEMELHLLHQDLFERQASLLKSSPQFQLYDRAGAKIFDTTRATDSAHFKTLGNVQILATVGADASLDHSLVAQQSSDFSSLTLSRELNVVPLTFAQSSPTTGSAVYIPGYPSLTKNRRKIFKAPDSDALTLNLSVGKIISPQNFTHAETKTINTQAGLAQLDQVLSLSDADSFIGQSGSPILNAEGQVSGILSMTTQPKPATSQRPRAQFRVSGPQIKWIQTITREVRSFQRI